MKTTQRHISRETLIYKLLFSHIYRPCPPFLGIILLSMLPAFLYGCDKAAENGLTASETFPATKVSIAGADAGIRTLDIFVFRYDRRESLDCYQRVEDANKWSGSVVSSCGERSVAVLANSPYGKEKWFPMSSKAFFKEVRISLEDESPEHPVMYGELPAEVLPSHSTERFEMSPITSEVRLNSVRCDFTGRSYEGENMTDVKVYLTNVNAECCILEEPQAPPKRIINAGGADLNEIMQFKDTNMIYRSIPYAVGTSAASPGIRFLCYQNNYPEETPGTPFTRLVIEGKIAGETYYWPININRDTETEPGIWRGRCYSYDITITRKGSSDPDIPISTKDITIRQEIVKWKEKEEYTVRF